MFGERANLYQRLIRKYLHIKFDSATRINKFLSVRYNSLPSSTKQK